MSGSSSPCHGEVAVPSTKLPSRPSTGNTLASKYDQMYSSLSLSLDSQEGSLKSLAHIAAPPRKDSYLHAHAGLLRKTFYRDPSTDTTTTVETSDSGLRGSIFSNSNFSIDISLSQSNSASQLDNLSSSSSVIKLPPIHLKTDGNNRNKEPKEGLFEKVPTLKANISTSAILPILHLTSLDLPNIVIPESHVSTPRTARVSPNQKLQLRTSSPTDNTPKSLSSPRDALIKKYKSDQNISREDFDIL